MWAVCVYVVIVKRLKGIVDCVDKEKAMDQ